MQWWIINLFLSISVRTCSVFSVCFDMYVYGIFSVNHRIVYLYVWFVFMCLCCIRPNKSYVVVCCYCALYVKTYHLIAPMFNCILCYWKVCIYVRHGLFGRQNMFPFFSMNAYSAMLCFLVNHFVQILIDTIWLQTYNYYFVGSRERHFNPYRHINCKLFLLKTQSVNNNIKLNSSCYS